MGSEIERRRAVDFAIGSVRLSGVVLDAACLADFELYALGKITTEEMRANVMKRYFLPITSSARRTCS